MDNACWYFLNFNYELSFRMKLILILITSLMLSSCNYEAFNLPVDVLGSDVGIINKDDQGKNSFIKTNQVPYKAGQSYYWRIFFRSNKELVTYTETITLSSPGVWNENSLIKVSDDLKSATVERTLPNKGFLGTVWTVAEGDPKGPVKIEVKLDGKSIKVFNYNIQ